jgi:hypothetical protein
MPLKLSKLETDSSIDMPELADLTKQSSVILAPFGFEAEEPMVVVSKADELYIKGASALLGRLTLGDVAFKDESSLSLVYENGKSRVIETGIPKLEWPARQDPVLTTAVRSLFRALWAIIVSRALQVGFPLHRAIISVLEDPTEQERKAVLHLTCTANVVQALAFWDSLEPDLQSWLETLRENDRITFITRMGLRVHWR